MECNLFPLYIFPEQSTSFKRYVCNEESILSLFILNSQLVTNKETFFHIEQISIIITRVYFTKFSGKSYLKNLAFIVNFLIIFFSSKRNSIHMFITNTFKYQKYIFDSANSIFRLRVAFSQLKLVYIFSKFSNNLTISYLSFFYSLTTITNIFLS